MLDRLLAGSGVERSALVGAGVGIPGPIDRRTGTVAQGAILPEWVGINILQRLEEALDLPVFLDNDATSVPCPKSTWGRTPHQQPDVLKIGSGIGAG